MRPNIQRQFQSTYPVRGATVLAIADGLRIKFQSTYPVRGATTFAEIDAAVHAGFQSTYPVRGATEWLRCRRRCAPISIHVPRAGCDDCRVNTAFSISDFNPRTPCGVRRNVRDVIRDEIGFQSTYPVRGATIGRSTAGTGAHISIHVPRAGCDAFRRIFAFARRDFNPRTPCGVRLPSRFAATGTILISIHVPRAGCDWRKRIGSYLY